MPGSDKGERQEREDVLQGDGISYEDHRTADVSQRTFFGSHVKSARRIINPMGTCIL